MKNLLRRARYYQGQMDQDHLQKNMDYSKLPDSFIVFICTFDPFGRELPVYSVKRIFEENGELADNGTHEAYFNCKDWRREFMTLEMKIQEAQEASFARGVQQGVLENSIQVARKMISKHMPFDEICEITGLSIERIEEIAGEE